MSETVEPRDKFVLGISDRYFPAWSEINARIVLRQNVQIAYVAAVGAVFTALASASSVMSYWLAVFLPFLGLVFTTWFVHHDLSIALLGAFLRACEERDQGRKNLPRYYALDGGFGPISIRLRYWSFWSFLMLQALALIPIILMLIDRAPLTTVEPTWELTEFMRIIGYASVLAGLASFVLSAYLVVKRRKIRYGAVVQLQEGGPWIFMQNKSKDTSLD